jgi:acyl carrier protein
LLDKDGALAPLDSLSIVELLTGLDESTGISVPTKALRPEAFVSIESVAALLADLESQKSRRKRS